MAHAVEARPVAGERQDQSDGTRVGDDRVGAGQEQAAALDDGGGHGDAADEAQHYEDRLCIPDLCKRADDRNGQTHPTHDLVWIHCHPP